MRAVMAPSPQRKPAVGFIFVTLVLAVVGFGLLIPVLPALVKEFKHGDASAGSHAYGWIISTYALMQFVGSPIMGSLSDRYGRRRIILIATAGSALDYVIMANAPTLAWLFVARTIAGFTAGVLSTANAYIADVTPPEKRAQSFGLLGAAFGIGFIIGPVAGGFLGDKGIWMSHFAVSVFGVDHAAWLSAHALRIPFWFAALCSTLNWTWGFFMLPESLKPENRRDFQWKRANPVGALLALGHLPSVLALAGSYFILMLAQTMLQSTWAIYTDARYHWGPLEIGLSLMSVGVLSGLVQATLVKKIVPRIGDARAVVVGFIISIGSQIGYGLASHGWMIYAILFVGAFAGISGPALQSYITKHVPANEQGAVQGVYAGLASLAGIPGPLLGTMILGWAVGTDNTVHLPWIFSTLDGPLTRILALIAPLRFPGDSFFMGALLTGLALYLALRTFRRDAHTPVPVPQTTTG
ncbi:MAG: TCR/Tet family transporter [Lacunisphaera sp.]|nr:TCR/Tet family transporter [Lacunisphaera sp.]